ncbi:molybdopterin synthase sulfur carrier subunit [Lacimicrobium alkaliphilum]|jgi:sulfur-carrier protein|uniref:Molybdopterin synthase sulfur carrier subunit n=2 Tax=Lacimicrobium alkaliphilum TaxID=1526571 RepID=A0A0U2ZI26_9ALTE|nr:molybdopterin synthase sulfur carrier subunit [Lacimicrobium alkaliphilum]ALS97996.1 molybdopterin synthase sulfur carrier subunit [Lacimicrobium alkaliphilum]GGD77802.1 molybdopterin synthase sulfur carrier subunit [Lacimicrobium alkaliphilum]
MKVLFFAQLREVLDCDTLVVEPEVNTLAELRAHLQQKGELWQEYLAEGKALAAVNQTLANDSTPLSEKDEVAFFPPVTGG